MIDRMKLTFLVLCATVAFADPVLAAACRADSGSDRAALVELYTSEGCSSCPPADRQLGLLKKAGPRVVPLALHVDYWDSIGWKDPFAQPAFAERQRWEVRANRHGTSFTPHFFVNGGEVLDWRTELAGRLRPVAAPPEARIVVAADPRGQAGLHVRVDATRVVGGPPRPSLQLHVVVTEGGLSTRVGAGENRGATLDHEAVARQWIAPIAIDGDHATFDKVVTIPQLPGGRVGIVAFVQDAATAEVLQAVDTGVCTPG